MLIGLDARHFYAVHRRGTGRNLVDLYTKLARVRPGWRVLAYHRGLDLQEDLLPSVCVRPARIEMVGDRLDAWQRWRLPPVGWRDRAAVLLEAADVLVYPSRGEGFGLPVLDAWSAGTAVLTSNTTSLPEVAADAALMAGVCALVERHRPRAVAGLGQHSTLMLRRLARRRALRVWYAGDDEDVLWKRSPLPSRMRACPRTCEVGGQGSPSSIRRSHPAPRLRSGSPLRSPIDT